MKGSLRGRHHILKGARELALDEIAPAVRARFAASLRASGERGCMVWAGALNGDGYGVVVIAPRPRRRYALAHRVAYAIAHGTCPPLLLDHTCETRACCEPSHLRPTTEEGNTPGIYDAPALARSRPAAKPITCVNGLVFRSVDALFAYIDALAEERHGPRCKHGWRYCAPCKRDAAPAAFAVARNTWSDS